MKDFFKMLFASTIGVILACVILGMISFFIFAGVIASAGSTPPYTLQDKTIFNLELNGVIYDREPSSNPFDILYGNMNQNMGLDDILDAIKKAKENDQIQGIYIKAGVLHSGVASLETIRRALIDFKTSDKFIIAYGDYYTQGAYYLASTADEIFLNPQGILDLRGFASSTEFYKGALDKIGIKMQVYKVGTYKSYVEPFIQDKMSDANREQVTVFLNDMWGQVLKGISESRNIPVDQLNLYADEYLAFSDPQKTVEYKLVDKLMYATDVTQYLKDKLKIEKDKDLKMAKVKDIKTVPFQNEKQHKEKIAILYAEGSIVADEVSNPYASSQNVITAKEYVKELNKLKDDENVKAVVFRINSGGGSAFASEQIWYAISELKKVKPVIASMGDYAASGGYYIACAADQIVAEHTTLTGSIGIFGIIPEGEELSKKLGLTYDEVSTNKHSAFGTSGIPLIGIPVKPFSEDESRMVQAFVERGYDTFLTRCADGRSKTKADIDSIGQGRVWTGNQALKNGLVDKLGNIETAVMLAAEKAGVKEYSLEKYPAQKDFFTQILEESMGEMQTRITQQLLGKEKFEQMQLINHLKTADIRMAVMPYSINN